MSFDFCFFSTNVSSSVFYKIAIKLFYKKCIENLVAVIRIVYTLSTNKKITSFGCDCGFILGVGESLGIFGFDDI